MNTNEIPSFLDAESVGKNHWWRYVIGVFLVILFSQFVGVLPSEWYINSPSTEDFTPTEWLDYTENYDFEALGLSKNTGLVMLIGAFAIGLITLLLVYRYLHNKPLIRLFTGATSFRWQHALFGFVLWGGLMLILTLGQVLFYANDYQWQLDWSKFIPLLLICLFILPIQTSFEELFLRGYLMQGIAYISKYPIIPVVITSLLFALLHIFNPEIEAYGWYIMMPYYFGVAFTAALIALLDNGLEIPLGLHAANNIVGAITITYEDAVIQTDSMWVGLNEDFNLGSLVIFYGCFVVMVYGSYRWRERGVGK